MIPRSRSQVRSVGVQLVRSATSGSAVGADRGDGSDQRFEGQLVVGVGGGDRHGQEEARPCRSVDGSCCRVCRGRPDWARSVHLPFLARTVAASAIARGPVQVAASAQLVRHRAVQPPSHPRVGRGGEPAVRGRPAHPERGRQVPPGASGGQHVDHRGEHRPALDLPGTPPCGRPLRRDQRFHDPPQLVRRQFPRETIVHNG